MDMNINISKLHRPSAETTSGSFRKGNTFSSFIPIASLTSRRVDVRIRTYLLVNLYKTSRSTPAHYRRKCYQIRWLLFLWMRLSFVQVKQHDESIADAGFPGTENQLLDKASSKWVTVSLSGPSFAFLDSAPGQPGKPGNPGHTVHLHSSSWSLLRICSIAA